jgi:CII-binding regulator of phage lambda lysogenization HflD
MLSKEVWNSEQAATTCDKLNIMASIHNRKLIAVLVRELNKRDSILDKFEERIASLEDQLNHLSFQIKGKRREEEYKKKGGAIM